MDHVGYLGTRLIMIDRCQACEVVWLDADEAGRMALLFARTNLRREQYAEQLAPLELADEGAAIREAQRLVNRWFRYQL